MKITKSQLKQIIKEELENVLNEGDSFTYAKENMLTFCKMGWSISNAHALWSVSMAGRMSAEDVSAKAQQHAKLHGDNDAEEAYGLQRATFDRSECERLVQR